MSYYYDETDFGPENTSECETNPDSDYFDESQIDSQELYDLYGEIE